MSTRNLKNISISKFESFLELAHCQFKGNQKGHCKYTRADLTRPIIFQNHIDPVPEMVLRSCLKTLGYNKDEFHDILEGIIVVEREANSTKFTTK